MLHLEEAGKAASTRRNCYAALRGAIDDAVVNGLIATDPVSRVKRPKAVHHEALSSDPARSAACSPVPQSFARSTASMMASKSTRLRSAPRARRANRKRRRSDQARCAKPYPVANRIDRLRSYPTADECGDQCDVVQLRTRNCLTQSHPQTARTDLHQADRERHQVAARSVVVGLTASEISMPPPLRRERRGPHRAWTSLRLSVSI